MNRRLASAAMLLVIALTPACFSRSSHTRIPRTSAASAEAPPVALPSVTIALEEEPPIDGEDLSRWPGLAPGPDETEPDPHQHHRHGGH